jgi:NhaP-type Na+/H+ or K+/H+ antiporter
LLGYAASRLTRTIDDGEVQITLTVVVAYSSYLLAYQLHLSGIIATASAGLIVGNLGTKDCSTPTKTALESFWAVCAKQSAFGIIAMQEFDRAVPVIFILPVRSNFMLQVHTKTA